MLLRYVDHLYSVEAIAYVLFLLTDGSLYFQSLGLTLAPSLADSGSIAKWL